MTLFDFERRWLVAIFEAVVPHAAPAGPASLGVASAPLDRFLLDLTDRAPAHFTLGLRACMWMAMLAPPFVLGRFRTFMGLAPEERFALLSKLGQSEVYVVREMPLLFKTIACLGLCGLPEVQARIGIHPIDSAPPAWARRSLPLAGER